jgi:hypothetical protein
MNKDIRLMILEKAARRFFMSHKEPQDLLQFMTISNVAIKEQGLKWHEIEEVLLKACFS